MSGFIDLAALAVDDVERRALEQASTSIPAVLSRICGIKPYPAIVSRIQRAASSPNATVSELAAIVETDVAFSSRMLRLVNSASVGLTSRCTTVKHAVALLGLRKVADVAAVTAALDIVQNESQETNAVLAHSLGSAAIARELAPFAGLSSDDAFTATLLHDVGELMFLQSGDPTAKTLRGETHDASDNRCDMEQQHLGFDHAMLGAVVLSTWNLPSPLPEVVLRHHAWPRALQRGGEVARMVALVRTADLLSVRSYESETPRDEDVAALQNEPAIPFLGLQPQELVRMWSQLRSADLAGRRLANPEQAHPEAATPVASVASPAPDHSHALPTGAPSAESPAEPAEPSAATLGPAPSGQEMHHTGSTPTVAPHHGDSASAAPSGPSSSAAPISSTPMPPAWTPYVPYRPPAHLLTPPRHTTAIVATCIFLALVGIGIASFATRWQADHSAEDNAPSAATTRTASQP